MEVDGRKKLSFIFTEEVLKDLYELSLQCETVPDKRKWICYEFRKRYPTYDGSDTTINFKLKESVKHYTKFSSIWDEQLLLALREAINEAQSESATNFYARVEELFRLRVAVDITSSAIISKAKSLLVPSKQSSQLPLSQQSDDLPSRTTRINIDDPSSSSKTQKEGWDAEKRRHLMSVAPLVKAIQTKQAGIQEKPEFFRDILLRLFTEKYPTFGGSAKSLESYYYNFCLKKLPTYCASHDTSQYEEDDDDLQEIDYLKRELHRYRRMAQTPLFDAICCNCGNMLYGRIGQSSKFKLTLSDNFEPNVTKFFNDVNGIPYAIQNEENKYYVCYECSKHLHRVREYFVGKPNTFNVKVPFELQKLTKDDKYMIALCGLHYKLHKEYQRSTRQFQHHVGEVNILHKDDRLLSLMFGVLIDRQTFTDTRITTRVQNALKWLKANNVLYQNFLANAETLYGFTPKVSIYGNAPIKTATGESVKELLGDEDIGLLVPFDDTKSQRPIKPEQHYAAIQHHKPETPEEAHKNLKRLTSASYFDPQLEAKAWPHLFPYGEGSWRKGGQLTMMRYLKWRLLNFDARFRYEREFLFFWIDRMFKSRVYYYNFSKRVLEKGRSEKLKVKDVTNPYSIYGDTVPTNIPGSRGYCASKTLDFLALVQEAGRKPDLFFTMTFNGNWKDLQADIEYGHGSKAEIEDFLEESLPLNGIPYSTSPIECTVAWHKRWRDFCYYVLRNKRNGPLGIVERYAYKFEYQKRGPVHVHAIIWVKRGTLPENSISAQVPREDDEVHRKLRTLVLNYQNHKCLSSRCFVGAKGRTLRKCKYGYPFAFHDKCELDKSGLRYLYPRTHAEDRTIVSYCPRLLMRYQCHHNLTFCSDNGIESYLTKYITKSEPTDAVFLEEGTTNPQRYFQTRIIGHMEAAILALQIPQCRTSHQVVFCPTEVEPKYKYLKRQQHLPTDPESTDIYYDSLFEKYLDRPNELRNLKYLDFVRQYRYDSNQIIMEVPTDTSSDDDDNSSQVIIFKDSKGRRLRKRKNHKRAVPRTRYYRPYGDDLESHCLQLLVTSFPWDRDSIANIISPNNSSKTYMEECAIRNLDFASHAKELVETAANRGYNEKRIRHLLSEMLRNKWVTEDDIDGIIDGINIVDVKNIFSSQVVPDEDTEPVIQKPKIHPVSYYEPMFSPSQRQCYEYVKNILERNDSRDAHTDEEQMLLVIAGAAGHGKSFMLQAIFALVDEHKLNSHILAPTGVAATIVNGQTVHSFFCMDVDLNCYLDAGHPNSYYVSNTDVLLIDEFSMLGGDLLIKVDAELVRFPRPDSPNDAAKHFGGRHIILFGDPAQLPPITRPIYTLDVFDNFKVIVLKHNARQRQDAQFRQILSETRLGHVSPQSLEALKSRIIPNFNIKNIQHARKLLALLDKACVLVSKRTDRDYYNNHLLDALEGNMREYHSVDTKAGTAALPLDESELISLRRGFHEKFAMVLSVKCGARVMLLRNCSVADGWVNGTLATVVNMFDNAIVIENMEKKRFVVKPCIQTLQTKSMAVGIQHEQYPLQLAWAVTVHKIQGMTLDNVYIHFHDFFSTGQAYTALSRTKTLEGVHFLRFDESCIKVDAQYLNLLKWMDKVDIISDNPSDERLQGFNNTKKEESIKSGTPILEKAKKSKKNFIFVPPVLTAARRFEKANQFANHFIDSLFTLQFLRKANLPSFEIEMYAMMQYIALDRDAIDGIRNTVVSSTLTSYHPQKHRALSNLQSQIHPAVYEHYQPVFTTGVGDCFYNAVSICLCGDESLTPVLRMLTTVEIVKHFTWFKEWMATWAGGAVENAIVGAATTTKHLQHADALIAQLRDERDHDRTAINWATEFTELATAVAIRKPINVFNVYRKDAPAGRIGDFFCNGETAEEFQEWMDTHQHGYMNHVRNYYPDDKEKDGINIQRFGVHFQALLPRSENSFKFVPTCPAREEFHLQGLKDRRYNE